MVTIAHFTGLLRTDAEHLEIDLERWLDMLCIEPIATYQGQMEHAGWSPVLYDPPRRERANVQSVYALVLDHDKQGDWQKLTDLWQGTSCAIYTTKSHGAPDSQGDRLRVTLSLSRPVSSDEHAKIWQWAAQRSTTAGCPPDQQCKDASRFWYTPSIPPGGWRSHRLAGAPIDVDAVLALAPKQPNLHVVRPRPAPDADQRMRRARAYLQRIPGAVSGDSGHTVTFNAVCHVMLGFDLSEADTLQLIQEEYNPRCSPEWSERELKHKILSAAQRSKRERGYLLVDRPRIETTRTAASYAPPPREDLDVDWSTKLLVNEEHKARRAYWNTAVLVKHHPEFRGKWSLDQMTDTPWFDGGPVSTAMIHYIRGQADCRLGYTPPAADVEAAIVAAAQDRPFHPIRQYLRSVDWDGEPRLASMARDYLGSEGHLHADMVRKFMIGAAARALWPGSKLDTALMLVGPQGYRKSTFFSVLGGTWHADSAIDITNKDSFLQLHAAWIYELSELENVVTGARESRLKAWITSTHDTFRAPYAKTAARRDRGCVIVGTSNRDRFLTDETGSRRFWIARVHREIPHQLLAEMRDQLWAEAVCAAEAGDPWWLDRDNEGHREEANKDFVEDDSWQEPIATYLADPRTTQTTIGQVLEYALKLDAGRHGRNEQTRAARVMVHLGWCRRQITTCGIRRWFYVRSEQPYYTGDRLV